MTKKHAAVIAAVIAAERKMATSVSRTGERTMLNSTARIANELADLFAEDNPRFDRYRFLAAAGVTP